MNDTHRALLKENFGRIWPAHVGGFARMMIALRAGFQGDLDLLLVLSAVGDRTLHYVERPDRRTFDDFLKGAAGPAPKQVNILSISRYTGIPRETVRRKINILKKRKWVALNEDGVLIATDTAARDLKEMTEATLDYLEGLLVAFSKLDPESSLPVAQRKSTRKAPRKRPGRSASVRK